MAEYRTVEGEPGAVNVLTNLTTFGIETAVGPIKVPAVNSNMAEIWAVVSVSPDTAAESGNVILRLSGKGMAGGDQDFVIGGTSGGASTATSFHVPTQILPVNIPVVPNETINVAVAVTDADVVLGTVGITLVFN